MDAIATPSLARRFFARRDPATDFILVLPVLLAYNLGLFLTGFRPMNGVDFITFAVVQVVGVPGFVAMNVIAAIAFIVAAQRRNRLSLPGARAIRPQAFVPVLIEGLVFGLAMGVVIVAILRGPFQLQLVEQLDPVERFVGSLGAGFFEEVVFRLVLMSLISLAAARWLKLGTFGAAALGVGISSLLFSLVHYVGFGSDPFSMTSFLYRFLAGVYLAAIYRLRGFAVAVYTHAIYDVHVLLF